MGPLDDIRVLELGVLIAGPFCGQLLGDFGAEVLKIEQPRVGDPMRGWGEVLVDGESLFWTKIARNKKSITLNLRDPKGQEIFKRLVADADVVVENFRPGTMEKWGLGYDVLSALNPGLVMTRVSGYGQTGPSATRAGYGSIGEAMGGLRYTTGDPDRLPSRTGLSIGDSLAGTYAALGTLTALHNRSRTGKGQVVDMAIYEAVFAMTEGLVPEYAIAGHIRERTGSILPKAAPSNVYPCKDGMVLIAANQDTVFKRLAKAMDREDLISNEQFASHEARGVHQTTLDKLISDWSGTFTMEELQALCDQFGVPCGKIFTAPDMLSDPQFGARDSIIEVETKRLGRVPMQNTFPRLTDTPGRILKAAPDLGEHNEDIYKTTLGMTEDEIVNLAKAGIV